eukprot:gene23610-9140_t
MQNFRNPLILTAPKIYLDTSQLPAGGGDVSEWNSFATAEVGGAGLPTLKTDETDRYVRFGTTDATNSKGNYLNLGTQTWNLQNGFTFVGVVRLYENKNWQRIFDFGNKVTGTGTITSYAARTLTNNWIGRSNWAGDSYACLDVREMAVYDRSITDSELSDVVGHLHYKYFSDPLLRKGPNIHLDASQLPQLSIDNTNVSSWNSFATAEVGGAGLPKLRTNEPNRYVRFGTTDATNSKGNYLNLGTQTWNLQNGFTFVGVVRFYQSKNWQRIFDFDNKVTGTGTITSYAARTLTNNWIGRSNWAGDSYACLDVCEMAVYDRSLTDSELSDVVGHLHYKYFSDPLLRKGPKIHLDASQLPQLSIDNTNVSSWNSFATAEVGGAGLPKLRTNEPNRYVRFGTTDATNSKGNYLNLGTQTWNLQNGFTFVGVVRFYESKNWQRIFDFDNKVTGTGTITSYAARTLTNNWIGRSNWSADSYACLDVREMAFYDRSLTDSELSDVVSYMRIKHFGDSIPTLGPLSIKSILDFVDPGGSSGENPYAMDKLFRGSRTPKYISSITRIPLAATEPARISFADFRGAGLTESPADVIGLYAWYTPESWDAEYESVFLMV